MYRVPKFLCCRVNWVPPPPFPCEMLPLIEPGVNLIENGGVLVGRRNNNFISSCSNRWINNFMNSGSHTYIIFLPVWCLSHLQIIRQRLWYSTHNTHFTVGAFRSPVSLWFCAPSTVPYMQLSYGHLFQSRKQVLHSRDQGMYIT
jgi:hypothetical protein